MKFKKVESLIKKSKSAATFKNMPAAADPQERLYE